MPTENLYPITTHNQCIAIVVFITLSIIALAVWPNQSSTHSLAAGLAKCKPGMSYAEVKAVLGMPDYIEGSSRYVRELDTVDYFVYARWGSNEKYTDPFIGIRFANGGLRSIQTENMDPEK